MESSLVGLSQFRLDFYLFLDREILRKHRAGSGAPNEPHVAVIIGDPAPIVPPELATLAVERRHATQSSISRACLVAVSRYYRSTITKSDRVLFCYLSSGARAEAEAEGALAPQDSTPLAQSDQMLSGRT